MTKPGSVQLVVDADGDFNSANYPTEHHTHSRVERFIDNSPPLSQHYGRSEQLNQQLDFQREVCNFFKQLQLDKAEER